MLTPPGMGGKKYRITGDRYPRMRRPRHRRRIILTLVAAACVLGLGGWGTLQLIDVFGGSSTTARATQDDKKCPRPGSSDGSRAKPVAGKPPKPAAVTVNVLNATQQSGLARRTADELKRRGFKIGKVGNAPAPFDKKVKGTGILLGSKTAAAGSLKVLSTQLVGAEQRTDGRKGGDLDLILGDAFKELTRVQDAEKALALLNRPSPEPSAAAKC
ncbi:LytR C-terminal domain-containing protein [Streptomyces halobius]|uniref:LytR C-terminal domain-containing protein n=1 Tax=Streptomyces halobius TaxID=2879846 RepID=A0ABY4MNG6_9ACTN|nr:LytR C-terminal domain-containing protein [Streptomyces halobius]UQA97861.1 LytR C-terminal domain-containing protein [Streptomyces halobius]